MAYETQQRAEKFKSKWENILKDKYPGPKNMKDFIGEGSDSDTDPQTPRYTNTQLHSTECIPRDELGRLHLQIRQDLIEKLIDEVFRRKRDPGFNTRSATQRAVIEQALDVYFSMHSPQVSIKTKQE